DSTDAEDRNIVGPDGYTNLEIYLNSMIEYPTDIRGMEPRIPNEFILAQNYPNPFNPLTKINFTLPYQTKVRINVYDIMGRKVAELINEKKSAGTYEVNFEAKNLSSGVYVYQLEYPNQVISKKMLLIK
ncbi:MAG: T9SS type A sorting domain-containing protein, partial [Ignavibacteriaceae bacterium]|nr:T9SS type A sorting domain-containing protein [Ignavibacteriaceae bacterium]